MDPPPAAVHSAAHHPHSAAADSIDSSPRSRTTEDDSLQPNSPKLRLMCSYGGHIVPRPHDKALRYVGGDTRLVVVDRGVSLTGLIARVAKTLAIKTKVFGLKYQLPNEDLDSLISIACDEDLEIMIEEYDRICSGAGGDGKGSFRLRLFVFPVRSDSVVSIESLLDCSVKSDEWFFSALNGSGNLSGGFSESASVNCLLGLENDLVAANNNISNIELGVSRGMDVQLANGGKNVKIANQDVHSMPDSPMMETTSSFGSANSTPSLANLPPIKVHEDDGGIKVQDHRVRVEEQFVQQTTLSPAADNFAAMSSPPPMPTSIITSTPVQPTVVVSSAPVTGDFQNIVVVDDARSDHSDIMVGHGRKSPQLQSQVQMQQKHGGGVDSPKPDLFPSDGSILNATPRSNEMGYQEVIQVSSGENRISVNPVDQRNNLIDPNTAPVQLHKPMQGSGYSIQPQIEPHHYPYQQQFLHGGMHYIVQQPGNQMAVPTYYPAYSPPQQQFQHPHQQPIQFQPQQYQHPVYIVQAPPPQRGYNMSIAQHTYPEGTPVVHAGHLHTPLNPNRVSDPAKVFGNNQNVSRAPNPEASSGIYRTTSVAAQPMVQVSPNLPQQQFVNYSQVNQQPQVTSAPNPTYNYEIQDPARAQIYYTQPLAPSLISQYQTMSSAQVLETSSNQPQNDGMNNSQIKSS